MIVQNVPPEFLAMSDPMNVFSEDSRFIYMLSTWFGPFSISVFDIIYNKFIQLLPDSSVTDILIHQYGYTEEDIHRPPTLIINNSTLLILFNDSYKEAEYEGCSLLFLVKLNFSDKTFSLIDYKVIEDCYQNSDTRLIKNGSNKFLLLHHFAIDKEEFICNDQFLGYYTFFLHDDKKIEFQENRIILDFDYSDTNRYFGIWYADPNNRLWVIKRSWRTMHYYFSYFDLNEINPKENRFEIIEGLEANFKFQWCNNFLLKYDEYCEEYDSEGKFSYFDTTTSQWSWNFKRDDLLRIEKTVSDLKFFIRLDTTGSTVPRHFDSAFNAFLFDKTKKQLQIVPFKTPLKLLDIAWITVLNNGLLEELDKRKIVIYPKLF